ncbi:MAG TPA: MOSC domain-containing protein [Burkholderiaceae bacterium]|nr:MOSC domain-containing protein [Burkholderiaceae bacterium]
MGRIVQGVNVPQAGGDPATARLEPARGSVEVGIAGLGADDRAARDHAALFVDDPEDHPISRALYAYPTAHHAVWRTLQAQARVIAFDEVDRPLPPASFDEHLALDGIQESELWIGDRLRLPHCELTVTAPRLPDARFDVTLGFAHASRMVRQSRWCGFWLAVLRPGTIAAGETFEVVPGPRATGLVELFRDLTRT